MVITMTLQQKNSRKQGDVGLGAAISRFCREGRTVSIPLTDNQSFDLVIGDENLKKVQVKTTTHQQPSDSYTVELRTQGGNRSGTGKSKQLADVDFIFVLTDSGEEYLIPFSEVEGQSTVTLGDSYRRWKLPK
jgi:hypothetical protein